MGNLISSPPRKRAIGRNRLARAKDQHHSDHDGDHWYVGQVNGHSRSSLATELSNSLEHRIGKHRLVVGMAGVGEEMTGAFILKHLDGFDIFLQGIARTQGKWYVLAWCRQRAAGRWFRFDRIRKAHLTKERTAERSLNDVFGEPPPDARPIEFDSSA